MRKRLCEGIVRIGYAALIALSVQASASYAENETLRFITGDDYHPYTGVNLPYQGIASELVRRAYEGSDFQIADFVWVP